MDLRQTPEYSKYMEILGWQVEKIVGNYIYIKSIPLIGKIAKLQRPAKKISNFKFTIFNEKHWPAVVYIEPLQLIKSLPPGFKTAKSAFLPAKTIQIDLTKTVKTLLKEMRPKTRYNIKIAQKRGVVVCISQDIEAFINLWKSAAIKRFSLPQDKEIKALWQSFGNKAYLVLAYKNDVLLAGVLIACSPDTSFYMYAASSQEGKKLFAPTLVAWETILLAKKKGSKVFDFEGIYDERYPSTKSWRGFTKFKEGFGGKVVVHPPTLVNCRKLLAKLFVF